jgi:hypothetical protein
MSQVVSMGHANLSFGAKCALKVHMIESYIGMAFVLRVNP